MDADTLDDPNSSSIAFEGGKKSEGKRRRLIRKRPVSYGISRNYHGNVYTVPADDSDIDSDNECIDGGDDSISVGFNKRIVAMIDVPPEHVPEGILNLIRAHRPFVEHVRVVIADGDGEDERDTGGSKGGEEKEESDNGSKNDFGLREADDDDTMTAKLRRDRTYLILVQLFREKDAAMFVEDLDGKPYIAFDDRDICRIERVVGVETTAPAMPGTADTKASALLSEPQNEGSEQKQQAQKQPQIDGKLPSTNHTQSLPLLHPSFGTDIVLDSEASSSQEKKQRAERKSSGGSSSSNNNIITRRLNIPANGENTANCAVCLEDLGLEEKKLDDKKSLFSEADSVCVPVSPTTALPSQQQPSLLTTVCNHTFHLDCLERCTGPCPVCRYDHSGLNETLSQCHVCGTTERNYVCLICGVVSCGIPHTTAEAVPPVAAAASSKSTTSSSSSTPSTAPRFYTSSHAGQHYKDTLHAYALDTETQHVYDFCGQGYVHRLVQNKEDGKLVEVNDSRALARYPGERSLTPGLSDAQEGEVVHRKLEGAAEQYNNLLKSQLEQQRAYYEERLNKMKREFSAEHQKAKAQDLLTVLKQEKKQVNQRLSSLQRRKAKTEETVSFLTNFNESLESNKIALKQRIQQAVREQNDSKQMMQQNLPALEAKVSELMNQLMEGMDD